MVTELFKQRFEDGKHVIVYLEQQERWSDKCKCSHSRGMHRAENAIALLALVACAYVEKHSGKRTDNDETKCDCVTFEEA